VKLEDEVLKLIKSIGQSVQKEYAASVLEEEESDANGSPGRNAVTQLSDANSEFSKLQRTPGE
jgi:hypothetical protein